MTDAGLFDFIPNFVGRAGHGGLRADAFAGLRVPFVSGPAGVDTATTALASSFVELLGMLAGLPTLAPARAGAGVPDLRVLAIPRIGAHATTPLIVPDLGRLTVAISLGAIASTSLTVEDLGALAVLSPLALALAIKFVPNLRTTAILFISTPTIAVIGVPNFRVRTTAIPP